MKKYALVHGLGVLFLISGATLVGGIAAAGFIDATTLRDNFGLGVLGAFLMVAAVLCLGGLAPRLVGGAVLLMLLWSGTKARMITLGSGLVMLVLGFVLILPVFGEKIASTELTGVSVIDKLVYRILHKK